MRTLLVGIALLLFVGMAGAAGSPTFNGLAVHFVDTKGMYYPPTLRRLRVSGRVVLAYSVGTSGRPERVSVLVSDDPRLEPAAVESIGHLRFEVPKTWAADAGQWRRFHLEFAFRFDDEPPRPRLSDDGEVITITATGIEQHP